MFLSAQALAIEYGINDRIAKFFVDREPPKDNLYWKDKLLYLRPQPGYIFIPLIADLYSRLGISIEMLLSDNYVETLEQILHVAAQEEMGAVSMDEMDQNCRNIVEPKIANRKNFRELVNYFNKKQGKINEIAVPFKSLQRGDIYLYSLCVLDLTEEKFLELVKTWFALISTLLMMDDSEDYLQDLESGDENVFVESGSNKTGFEAIKKLLSGNLGHLESINYSMAHALHKRVLAIPEKQGIKEYLNA